MQGPELTVDNLAALARLGTNATARGDESGEASHQEAMTACEQLSRSFLQRSAEPFEGSDFTSAAPAGCLSVKGTVKPLLRPGPGCKQPTCSFMQRAHNSA